LPDKSGRTSNPEEARSRQQGQADVPEANRKRSGHDAKTVPSTSKGKVGNETQDDSPDKKDVQSGSDSDSDDASLGV